MFKETGSVKNLPKSGRFRLATVEHGRQSFQRSPNKSTCEVSRELQTSQASLLKILHKRHRFVTGLYCVFPINALGESSGPALS
ncbi:hypothetical protein TNCV_3905251 [Trichonephila clavipes]|nr:hypothetical protein TNCV_3905251 [Trichonephila clavipes]